MVQITGIPRKLGVILASKNQFELDYVASQIIGIDMENNYIVAESIKRELLDIKNIKVVGESIEEVKVSDFRFPANMAKRAFRMAFGFTRYMKPYPIFHKETCKLCRACVERCPREALHIKNGRVRLIKKKCIRCFCCHEHCSYKAIDIKHRF